MKKITISFLIILFAIVGINKAKADSGYFTYTTNTIPQAVVGAPYNTTISFEYSGTRNPELSVTGLPVGITKSSIVIYNNGVYTFTLSGIANIEGNYPLFVLYNDQTTNTTGSQTIDLVVSASFNLDGFNNLNGEYMTDATTGTPYAFEFSVKYNGNGIPGSSFENLPVGFTASGIYESAEQYLIDVKGNPTTPGIYPLNLTLTDYETNEPFPLLLKINQGVVPEKPVASSIDPVGTNILTPDGTVSMIASDGTRRPYTSSGAFLSYGFNSWSGVVTANAADAALPIGAFIPPRDGTIVCSDRSPDEGTCYLISDGQKAGFTSATVFTALGFNFSDTVSGDVSWMSSTNSISSATSAHLSGVLINNSGTYELVITNGFIGIPDEATLQSWGYSLSDAVPANVADQKLAQATVLEIRQAGQLIP